MSTPRAPKQWCLTKNETINTFENWKQNLIYTLSLDVSFAPFLVSGTTWLKKTRNAPLRGFTDDPAGTSNNRRTAAQKVAQLEMMLGQIANFCPIISRNTIVKTSISIDSIWQVIRAHYGFQTTGANFLEFINIKLKSDERPEDLYQRIMAFVEDSLLVTTTSITHHGEILTEDEEITPTLENLVVLLWLQLIHKDLPGLVKQRYGPELRSRTLASIKPEISQAMDSLLDTLQSNEEAKIMRSAIYPPPQHNKPYPQRSRTYRKNTPSCPLCQVAGRQSSHYLSKCPYLPEQDRKFLTKARLIAAIDTEGDLSHVNDLDEPTLETHVSTVSLSPTARRVQVNQSPFITMYHHEHPLKLTFDSGAETNMIKESVAKYIGAKISTSTQMALQADGTSPLAIKGETKLTLTRNNNSFILEALVVENIDVDVLAGVPFMSSNDVSLRPAKSQIIFSDGSTHQYQQDPSTNKPYAVKRASVHILRSPGTTVWPGEFVELDVPEELSEVEVAVEPRIDNRSNKVESWPPPSIIRAVAGKIRIANITDVPQVLKKNDHFAQAVPVSEPITSARQSPTTPSKDVFSSTPPIHNITVDEGEQLPADIRSDFHTLHKEFHSVFNPYFQGYNGTYGPIQAVVNMGTTEPPQRKGRIPQYSKDKLVELQRKFDELETLGVFSKPEDINVVAEYLNPSFLIKKPSGGFRLVTSFGEVAKYAKPQPALMPDINTTLRLIGQWKYIIKTDLTQAFYQIPLAKDSMKYCGVATPFKGVRVYTRSAMGMPGSETALEELMSRVLGDLLQDDVVAKVADDLYCGGKTAQELLGNWKKVLTALHSSNLTLSASKTVIAPRSTTILGWTWSNGTLCASPHRIATLSTCSRPTIVKGLRSFLGAYKFLARVVPNCSTFLSPLESLVAGKPSQEQIIWYDTTTEAFKSAQQHLQNHQSITLPKPEDQLWLVTDGAVKSPGIGSTLYLHRNGKIHIAGFFSAKLKQRQNTWTPCEIEALSIAASLQHYSPYVIQSHHRLSLLTDSKPCVQAYQKLLKGNFSNSSRVTTFLSTASRYAINIQHLAGSSNAPSDFACRNAIECLDPTCQICSFVNDLQVATVHAINITDIAQGTSRMPFITRSTWLSTQQECQDLRRTRAYLSQGTRPSKKLTNLKDTKRYLNCCTIAKDGMLVVPRNEPFSPTTERIVVPRFVLQGLLTALHIRLSHPTQFQLKQLFCRYFFALDLDSSLNTLASNCHTCLSLMKVSNTSPPAVTSEPPPTVGRSFTTDVIKRNKQLILVLRETVTSFTAACLIDTEDHLSLRDGIIKLCVELRPLDGPPAVIRTDPAPGFVKLNQDKVLLEHRITIDIGRVKNVNKNPVAEKAIQELEDELLRQDPDHPLITPTSLAVTVARLNSRIRGNGLSARELWTQRDQFSHKQLPLDDRSLIQNQYHRRLATNTYNNQKLPIYDETTISTGALVYLKQDKNKSQSRPRYLVVQVERPWYHVKKFVGNQLRNFTYKVHQSELFTIPDSTNNIQPFTTPKTDEDSTDETDVVDVVSQPNLTFDIPTPPPEIISPLQQEIVLQETPPTPTLPLTTPFTESHTPQTVEQPQQRPQRNRRPPSRFQDYETEWRKK